MTYEETKARLKELGHYCDDYCDGDCEKCYMEDRVLEALEKQIPIKAEYHAPDFDVRMFSWWSCGNCGCEIGSVVDKYCSYCGRPIDWSDNE